MLEDSFTVSQFIELLNQTYELAYPVVSIVGELANFRVSKNKWLYFDLKDEYSNLKMFGTVYSLRQPLEDGMLLKVICSPKMHNLYGFTMQVQGIELVGEGSLKRSAELLQIKLSKEGIFDMDKKRSLPYPPTKIALITSAQSAAYHDFTNIIYNRWRGLDIHLIDVQVQGELAIKQIVKAIDYFNRTAGEYDVIVLIRGGGSPEDLAVFSTESVTRAVAASHIPTLVAIGHEIDISLAELAADRRASTPSHAAELLVPDKRAVLNSLKFNKQYLDRKVRETVNFEQHYLEQITKQLHSQSINRINSLIYDMSNKRQLINAYNPKNVLNRGYSIVRKQGKLIRSVNSLSVNDILDITLATGSLTSEVKLIKKAKDE